MRGLFAAALVVALVGCGDRGPVDFGGEDLGPDIHAINGEDGGVKMGLTREWVYFALSDSAIAEARAELEGDADEGGARGFFGRLMQNVVGKALNFRARYAVEEIRDIRWENDGLRIEFVDPERELDRNLQFNEDTTVDEAFAEEDVLVFAAAFRAVKAGLGGEEDTQPQR